MRCGHVQAARQRELGGDDRDQEVSRLDAGRAVQGGLGGRLRDTQIGIIERAETRQLPDRGCIGVLAFDASDEMREHPRLYGGPGRTMHA